MWVKSVSFPLSRQNLDTPDEMPSIKKFERPEY